MARSASATSTRRPSSAASEVTSQSAMPHGTIMPKRLRSGETLKANPWLEIQREILTPMAAELLAADPHAGQAVHACGGHAEDGGGADHHFLEVADVATDVATVWLQVEDRISHELPRAVIGHVTAAAGVDHINGVGRQELPIGPHVLIAVPRGRAARDHVRVLQQQQHVVHPSGATILDQPLLQLERVAIRDRAEAPNVHGSRTRPRLETEAVRPHTIDSSNCSSPRLTWPMNWSATTPSIRRWSKPNVR